MAKPENIIAYRIVRVAVEDFKMQPQQLNEKEKLGINTSFSFQANFDLKCIRCLSSYVFSKGENKLIELTLSCVFSIEPSTFESLYDESKTHLTVEAYFCRYMATIAVGAARGAIAAKTQGTPLEVVVLPPINLIEIIKNDSVFNVD
jgi:hypothetical protein